MRDIIAGFIFLNSVEDKLVLTKQTITVFYP